MKTVTLQWRRTSSKGGLELWVSEAKLVEDEKEISIWSHYKKAIHYKADMVNGASTESGFATFQNYLNLSKKGLFKLEILKVNPEDMAD